MNTAYKAERREFARTALKISAPIALTQILTALINLLDTFMLGDVSEAALTAAGLANKLFFVFIIITYGIATGAGIFMAQFFGKGDERAVRKYLGLSLALAGAAGVFFTVAALAIPNTVMGIYTGDSEVTRLGAEYLRITASGYIPTAITSCIFIGLRSCRRTVLPLILTFAALIFDTALTYYLIYHRGMGVRGAAVATLTARIVELVLLVISLSCIKTVLRAPLKEFFSFTRSDVRAYFKVAGLVILAEAEWSVGFALYAIAFKKFGTVHQAAVQVTDSCLQLFNTLVISLGSAAAVVLGNKIGEGDKVRALRDAKRFYWTAIVLGAVVGVAVIAVHGFLPAMFSKLSADGRGYASFCLLVIGIAMPLRSLEFMLMVGVLRSGGDTLYCVICDLISLWGIALPATLLAAWVFGASFELVYCLMSAEIIVKSVIASVRVFSPRKNWIRDVTQMQGAGRAEREAGGEG